MVVGLFIQFRRADSSRTCCQAFRQILAEANATGRLATLFGRSNACVHCLFSANLICHVHQSKNKSGNCFLRTFPARQRIAVRNDLDNPDRRKPVTGVLAE